MLAVLGAAAKVAEYGARGPLQPYVPASTADKLSALSWILFVLSAVVWLHISSKRLEKMDQIAQDLVQIRDMERLARYGLSGVLVASLLGGEHVHAHGKAGYETISPILWEHIPRSAKGFYDLDRGELEEIRLREFHIVDTFLLNLIKALPNGSVWMGISRLNSPDAWREKTAAIDFYNFHRDVESRSSKKEMTVTRLYVFNQDEHVDAMMPIMDQQRQAGIDVRHVTNRPNLRDISLVWIPTHAHSGGSSANATQAALEAVLRQDGAYQPLCAIEFQTRGGRELDEMVLHAPGRAFDELAFTFQSNWPTPGAANTGPEAK